MAYNTYPDEGLEKLRALDENIVDTWKENQANWLVYLPNVRDAYEEREADMKRLFADMDRVRQSFMRFEDSPRAVQPMEQISDRDPKTRCNQQEEAKRILGSRPKLGVRCSSSDVLEMYVSGSMLQPEGGSHRNPINDCYEDMKSFLQSTDVAGIGGILIKQHDAIVVDGLSNRLMAMSTRMTNGNDPRDCEVMAMWKFMEMFLNEDQVHGVVSCRKLIVYSSCADLVQCLQPMFGNAFLQPSRAVVVNEILCLKDKITEKYGCEITFFLKNRYCSPLHFGYQQEVCFYGAKCAAVDGRSNNDNVISFQDEVWYQHVHHYSQRLFGFIEFHMKNTGPLYQNPIGGITFEDLIGCLHVDKRVQEKVVAMIKCNFVRDKNHPLNQWNLLHEAIQQSIVCGSIDQTVVDFDRLLRLDIATTLLRTTHLRNKIMDMIPESSPYKHNNATLLPIGVLSGTRAKQSERLVAYMNSFRAETDNSRDWERGWSQRYHEIIGTTVRRPRLRSYSQEREARDNPAVQNRQQRSHSVRPFNGAYLPPQRRASYN